AGSATQGQGQQGAQLRRHARTAGASEVRKNPGKLQRTAPDHGRQLRRRLSRLQRRRGLSSGNFLAAGRSKSLRRGIQLQLCRRLSGLLSPGREFLYTQRTALSADEP